MLVLVPVICQRENVKGLKELCFLSFRWRRLDVFVFGAMGGERRSGVHYGVGSWVSQPAGLRKVDMDRRESSSVVRDGS